MELSALTAISPIDGRYWSGLKQLSKYFSEYGLIQYRVEVEVEYFIALCKIPLPPLKDFPQQNFDVLRGLYQNFTEEGAQRIKQIESVTNHDVKAVEYFIKESVVS
jgi:adenylosuccinate lyase